MIARIWHGCTSRENADVYENLIKEEIFPEIESKIGKGYKRAQLLKRELEDETEFTTIIWFENMESVISLAGENYENVYIPAKALKVLSRFDKKAVHLELRHDRT